MALVAFGGVALGLGSGPERVTRTAASQHDATLYFTTYHPPGVDEVSYRYAGGRLTLGTPRVVAHPPGADGILFGPDGNLLVGGQGTGKVFSISPSSGAVRGLPTGVPVSYHLALDPTDAHLYTAAAPGPLSEVPLKPPGPGHPVPLRGSDTRVTALAFAPGGVILYTASSPAGVGNIGLLNLANDTTHRLLTDVPGAHGAIYDPFSHSFMVVGSDVALQLPVSDPGHIASELTVPHMQFDQLAVTGTGQAFLASNTGSMVLVDYSGTGRIGAVADRVIITPLAANLDDVAPLVGLGARPVVTAAHTWRVAGASSFAAAALVVLAAAGRQVGRYRRSRPAISRLPRWDRRRRSSGH